MSGERVLIVEDDPSAGAGLRLSLTEHGYDVVLVTTGREALSAAEGRPPEIVLLDLGLPDLDGVHVCRVLREKLPFVPIVMVTARDADIDVVVGLDAGANDYVIKPFTMAVLLARLRAHLRRPPATDADSEVVTVGELHIDTASHRAFLAGDEIELRPKEYALLHLLVTEVGRVVTRDRLLNDLWDLRWESSTKTLDMHVHALRRKLGDRPNGSAWISTVRSIGYRFESP